MRSEFESIVEGLSLDESSPTTFLDDLDRLDNAERFIAPIPPRQNLRSTFMSAKKAFARWFNRGDHDDDGAHV
ncbi:unannotated protein [freshwater metagenome]|uniref:Unannotated protein n=1 Tax=freshwater metagenome TaxID=449393 RepID=A0A6J6ZH31_9ZZZZ